MNYEHRSDTRLKTYSIQIRKGVKFRRDASMHAEELAVEQAYDGQRAKRLDARIIHRLRVLVKAYARSCQ